MITKYYISFNNSDWSEFFPSNNPLVKFEREGQEVFKRPKVDLFHIAKSKNLTVYNQLASRFFDDTYFGTDIYYKININGVDKFKFIQPINKGKLNSQNGYFECTPDADDAYRDLMLQYDRKWLMSGDSSELFQYTGQIWVPKINTDTFINQNFTTFTDTAGDVTWSTNGENEKTARLLLPSLDAGDFVTLVFTEFTGILYFRLTTSGGAPLSDEVLVDDIGASVFTLTTTGVSYLQMRFSLLAPSNGAFKYKLYYPVIKESGAFVKNIIDVCINGNGVTDYMGLSYTLKSAYLWNDALPTGASTDTPNIYTYINAHSTNDYVIEAAAQWNKLWLARTNVLTTNKEDNTEVSLKDLMTILKVKLRAYWFIDADGYFRIEHEKYFKDFVSQADITSSTDKPEIDAKLYNYDDSQLANQVLYKENNAHTIGFINYSVHYDVKKTSSNIRDVMAGVSTDVEYISSNPGAASSEGLLLMRGVSMGTKVFVELDDLERAPGYGEYHPNMHLSWDYIVRKYFGYNNDALTGYLDPDYTAVETTFTHVKEFLKQPKVRFRLSNDFDWKKPFTASLGTAWHDAVTYDPETGFYTVDLCYNPYAL